MSQLVLLRQVLHKQHFLLNTCFQRQRLNSIYQCAISRQKIKGSEAGQDLRLSETGPAHADVSTDVKPLGEKIKENTKTATYTVIILLGIGTTAVMFWAIFRELFSSSSPNNVYSKALERVIKDPRVQDSLGAPIKGYGEESRRGRRQHVAHSSFERNGVLHIRMRFYVQGSRNKATVHLESRMTPSGQMQYRYLFVQLDHYPHTTIILEDNRASDGVTLRSPLTESGLSFASFDGKN